MVNCLLKKYAIEYAIFNYDVAILRYVHPTNMTPRQFFDNLIANSCKVAYEYVKKTLKDVFIEGFDAFTCNSPQCTWSTNSQTDLTDITFQSKFLLSVQKRLENITAIIFPTNNLENLEKPYHRKPCHNWKSVNK